MLIDRFITKRRVSIFKDKLKERLQTTPFYIDDKYVDETSFIILSKNTEKILYIIYQHGEYFGYYSLKSRGYISGFIYFYPMDNIIRWLNESMDSNI